MKILPTVLVTFAGCSVALTSFIFDSASANPRALRAPIGRPHAASVRRRDGTGCVAGGQNSFVGASNESNAACDEASGIMAGSENLIGSGNDNAAFSGIGAGEQNAITGGRAFIGGGFRGNLSGGDSFIGAGDYGAVTSIGSFLGAGGYETYLTCDCGPANDVAGQDSFIGAGDLNGITGRGSFIGAGGFLLSSNTVTVPGNIVGGDDSFIGAGDQNNVAAAESFVGSGSANTISSAASYSAILGGLRNKISGIYATVIGGYGNTASGSYAIVAGGNSDTASGILTYAAGYHATASHNGSFVWSDYVSGSKTIADAATNQFVARASGGTTFYSNEAATSGVKLAAGSGTWSNLSDRNAKTDVASLDDDAVLDKVVALPVKTWRYTSESGVRHVGPMAQDFYAAFGVGEDDRHITSIDEDGIALAAVKGLDAKLERKNAEIGRLHAEVGELRSELTRFEASFATKHR